MSIKDKFLRFVAPEDDDDDDYEEDDDVTEEHDFKQDTRPVSTYEQSRNSKVKSVSADTKMVLFEPRSLEEAEEIARHLKQRKASCFIESLSMIILLPQRITILKIHYMLPPYFY